MAELAGIGNDWYTRLEQGRSVRPSAATIDALARALRLDKIEHLHLRALARITDQRAFERETVPAAVRRAVQGLGQPAYITGQRWDILAWNTAAIELFTDFGLVSEQDRNILVYMLTDSRARHLFGESWAQEARRMVAQFRTSHDLWPDDPAFLDLRDRLRKACPEFGSWWKKHEVRGTMAGSKLLSHPKMGRLEAEYATFQANDDPRLKLTIYSLRVLDRAVRSRKN